MTDSRLKAEWVVERQGKQAVLYAGLLHLAHLDGLKNIAVTLVQIPSELNGMTAIAHATVETGKGEFSEIGDASPTNVTRMIVPHIIRMAATRAKARALRDAVDIGMVAAEELGDEESPAPARRPALGGVVVERTYNPPTERPATAHSEETRGILAAARPIAELRAEYDDLRGRFIATGGSAKELPVDVSPVIAQKWITALRERMELRTTAEAAR